MTQDFASRFRNCVDNTVQDLCPSIGKLSAPSSTLLFYIPLLRLQPLQPHQPALLSQLMRQSPPFKPGVRSKLLYYRRSRRRR